MSQPVFDGRTRIAAAEMTDAADESPGLAAALRVGMRLLEEAEVAWRALALVLPETHGPNVDYVVRITITQEPSA